MNSIIMLRAHIVCLAFACLSATQGRSQDPGIFDWPSCPIGYCDWSHGASYWVGLEKGVELTNGLSIPMAINRTSKQTAIGDSVFGHGWWFPLFEGTITQISEECVEFRVVNGKPIRLWLTKDGHYASKNNAWKAVLGTKDDFIVNGVEGNAANYEIRFNKGLIKSLKLPDGDLITWGATNQMRAIKSARRGELTKITLDNAGLAKELVIDEEKVASFGYEDVPIIVGAPSGHYQIAAMKPSLRRIFHKNDRLTQLECQLDQEKPNFKLAIFDSINEVTSKYEILEWDGLSGSIISDRQSLYDIKSTGTDSKHPNFHVTLVDRSSGQAANSFNYISRSKQLDLGVNGLTTRYLMIGTEGANYLRTRKKILLDSSQKIISEKKYFYDKDGNLIREIFPQQP